MKPLVIFDLDGCVIDNSKRLPFLQAGNFDLYCNSHYMDTELAQGATVARMFLKSSFDVLFITARQENLEPYTREQVRSLVSSDVYDRQILMRPSNMPRSVISDAELKPYLLSLTNYRPEHVFLAFDDNKPVVDKWRSLGIECYQTQDANY